MKKLVLGALLAAALALSIPAAASAAEYETFVGCEISLSATPSESCQIGDSPGAYFESDEETEFDVCVEFPDGEVLCAEEQEAEANVLYVNEITTEIPGDHFVIWFVGPTVVGEWEFSMSQPTPPAPPAPPALPALPAPAPAILPAGPTQGCLKARKRVTQIKNQLENAEGRKQRARLRRRRRRGKPAEGARPQTGQSASTMAVRV
jgi:hypothetical protein